MVKKKPICFISYCREGADHDSISHLVQSLKDESRNQIDFLIDEELPTGSNIKEFMELIRNVDGVIMILTPQYKLRVDDRQGGVNKEFDEILNRYNLMKDKANQQTSNPTKEFQHINSPFCLLPLIFSGTFERSCPNAISDLLTADFTAYRAHRNKNGALNITDSLRMKFKSKISKIISEITTYYSTSSPIVAKSFDDLLTLFFEETKHERVKGDITFDAGFSHVFVKTHAYKKVKRQSAYLLIGRKGSGKSTISHYLSLQGKEEYKEHIDIDVNQFNLEYPYSFINIPQTQNELNITLTQVQIFETTWELFLYICCMYIIVREPVSGNLRSSQSAHISPIIAYLSTIVNKDITQAELDHKSLFQWCYSKVIECKEKAIKATRNELPEFSYDISNMLNPTNMVRDILTPDVVISFESILRLCSRRFFVSLDGFDTAFEEFRIRTEHPSESTESKMQRTSFEIDWLRGFIHVVVEMKSPRRITPLATMIDFCIMVPKDRFMEIRNAERDAVVYVSKDHDIRWSGIELLIMLRKRLELLGGDTTSKNKRPHERLDEILSSKFPCIPRETVVTVASKEHKLPIFIDVIRHTFWRPREILIYFAKIIAVLRDLRSRNIDITLFAVEKCISDTTREIVSTEFINEFQRHCTNIVEIIEKFRGANQISDKKTIFSTLENVHFIFIDKPTPCYDLNEKISFLYEIGFFGIDGGHQKYSPLKLLNQDVFWFNAGDEPYRAFARSNFEDCKFIIHPIFCEYLDLNTGNQRLSLDFDWNYLYSQESHVIVPS